jgi:hypothetical protein
MDSGTGRIGKGHARVETTKQHLHPCLPVLPIRTDTPSHNRARTSKLLRSSVLEFLKICGGKKPSKNKVVVQARQPMYSSMAGR